MLEMYMSCIVVWEMPSVLTDVVSEKWLETADGFLDLDWVDTLSRGS
jgi:hypothetical protein